MTMLQARPDASISNLTTCIEEVAALNDAGATPAELVDAAAGALRCIVVLDLASGTQVVALPRGCSHADLTTHAFVTRALSDGGLLSIEHDPDEATDDLRRLALISISAFVGDAARRQAAATSRNLSDDIRAVIDEQTSDGDRIPALARLHLGPTTPIVVLALWGPTSGTDRVIDQIRASAAAVHHLVMDTVHLVMAEGFRDAADLRLPVGVSCAYTPPQRALQAAEMWRGARNGLRFAVASSHEDGPQLPSESTLIDTRTVGIYAILADLDAADLARNPDVQRIEALHREHGPELLDVLLAVAANDSLRAAAKVLHFHHNSVGYRVAKAERVLGFSCTGPYGRARLLLILTAHRLLESKRNF